MVPKPGMQRPMQTPKLSRKIMSGCYLAGFAMVFSTNSLCGQTDVVPEPLNWTTQQDHQNMMEQLGIKALRPGPSGKADAPNA